MKYEYVTQDDQDDIVAAAIQGREKEHYHYQLNIDNYRHILDQLSGAPAELPERLRKHKSQTLEQMSATLSAEDVAVVSHAKHRDRVKQLLATEIAEQSKCESAYNALVDKLPKGPRRDASMARIQSRLKK